MPPKKKTRSTSSKRATKKPVVRKPKVSSSQGSSYDNMMIVTILLLIFVYPLGIVFMWTLMKTWPTWLKIVITLPLLIAIFFTIVVVYFVGQAVRSTDWKMMEQRQYERMQRREQRQNMRNISPTPTTSPYTF